jgi:hypothetical protein
MAEPDAIVHLDFEGPLLLPGPKTHPARVLGLVDWAADDVILRRVLRRLRDFDGEYANQLKLTAAAADRIAERLGVGSAVLEVQLDAQRLMRIRRVLARLTGRAELVAEVVDALIVSDAVKPELENRRAQVLDECRREAAALIAHETQTARHELETLTAERESLNTHLKERKEELETLQASLEARVEGFESALRRRLSEMAANVEQSFADLTAIRAVFSADPARSEMGPLTISGPAQETGPEGVTGGEEVEIAQRDLRQRFASAALPISLADALHSTFIAGAIPLLVGTKGFPALALYASRVAGGRVLWAPVAGDVSSTAEFLGRVRGVTNGSGIESGGLLEFLSLASAREDLHVVVLDGINLAPIEVYLLPVLDLYRDVRFGGQSRRLRFETSHGRPVDLRWPRNVLLAGIFREGLAALPIPPSAWSSVVFLDPEAFGPPPPDTGMHPDDRDAIASAWPVGSISLTSWDSLKRRCREQDLSNAVALWNEARERFRLPSGSKDEVMRFFAAAYLLAGADFALACVARGMLPHVASEVEKFIVWVTERRMVPASEASAFVNVRKLVG